jgi:hypothetical protein
MVFDAKSFSKDLKIARYAYQYGDVVNHVLIKEYLRQLEKVSLTKLVSDTAKNAFWINVYNGMTNYAIIKHEIKGSMKEDAHFFKRSLFKIDAMSFSLDDIEHGILRRNARHHLEAGDSKLEYMVNRLDYRIHFALNCGAQSCPAIAFYDEVSLEEELNLAETSFVSQEFSVVTSERMLQCSALFEWYREDFGNLFLNDPLYQDYKVTLTAYDWGI